MLNISNDQGNANLNHNELLPHSRQNGYYPKNPTNDKWLQGHGEKGILQHYWWKYELVQLLWKTVWRVLRNLKIEKFTIAKYGSNLSVHQQMNEGKAVCVCIYTKGACICTYVCVCMYSYNRILLQEFAS